MLFKYVVDLRTLKDEERKELRERLHILSETGITLTKEPGVFTIFLDESINPQTIPGLSGELLHRVP